MRTLDWAARVAADATDRRAREAGRDKWAEYDRRWYNALVWELATQYNIQRDDRTHRAPSSPSRVGGGGIN